jgi:hypothetical protein
MDAFQYACVKGDLKKVETMISSDDTVKLHSMTPHKYTPLMLAAFTGHLDVVNSLIKHKADVNFSGPFFVSALGVAIGEGHKEVTYALLDAKADTTRPVISGKSMVALAISWHQTEIFQRLLQLGAPVDVDKAALPEDCVDDPHRTALYAAVLFGGSAAVRTVLPASDLTGEAGYISLAAAAEDDDLTCYRDILAEMQQRGAVTEEGLHRVLMSVFKKKNLAVLESVLAAAKQVGVDLLNRKFSVQYSWIFYYAKFKKDMQLAFGEACGVEGDDVDVAAYPLSVAVFCGWAEAALELFAAGEAAHAEARDVAQFCGKMETYEEAAGLACKK